MEWLNLLRARYLNNIALSSVAAVGPIVIAATIALYLFAGKIQQLVVVARAASTSQSAQKAQAVLEKTPLPVAELQRYQEVLTRLHPAVSIELSGDSKGFQVSVSDPRLYNEWIFALYSLQSYGKNVLWEATRLCLKNCSGGAAMAEVQGYTQAIRFK